MRLVGGGELIGPSGTQGVLPPLLCCALAATCGARWPLPSIACWQKLLLVALPRCAATSVPWMPARRPLQVAKGSEDEWVAVALNEKREAEEQLRREREAVQQAKRAAAEAANQVGVGRARASERLEWLFHVGGGTVRRDEGGRAFLARLPLQSSSIAAAAQCCPLLCLRACCHPAFAGPRHLHAVLDGVAQAGCLPALPALPCPALPCLTPT